LNPPEVHGQIHGGIAQGLGRALGEEIVHDPEGQLLTTTFLDYELPTIDKVPHIESILIEVPSPEGPFGARGVGEPPAVPGAAAVANAVRAAVGIDAATLPIRPADLLAQLNGSTRG
jgi:CO/xanthine dehydrogenase Mo-binding subunit